MVTCAGQRYRYEVASSAAFCRQRDKFLGKHPDLRGQFTRVAAQLARNPFAPILALHTMRFADGLYAVSLTYSYRLLVRIEGRAVVLVAIGSHEMVYRHREGR